MNGQSGILHTAFGDGRFQAIAFPHRDAALNQESLSNEVDRALRQLHEREREILKMFFGIGCQEMTLEEIGAKFDLTRERVRQIKEKAIRRLKGQKSRLLKSYLGS